MSNGNDTVGVGLVGTGRRGLELARILADRGEEAGLRLRAIHNRTESKATAAAAELGGAIRVAASAEDLIADPSIDLVMVCTPQYAHREPATAVLRAGKHLSLDKPLAHNLEDSLQIARVARDTASPVIMSFTRRFEHPWRVAYDLIHGQDAIGPLRMILARNVIPYHVYFHTWHRRLEWSGGATADKMSHMFDVMTWFARARPLRLTAFGGQAVFRGDPLSPKRCSACDRDCPYRVADGPTLRARHGQRPDDMLATAAVPGDRPTGEGDAPVGSGAGAAAPADEWADGAEVDIRRRWDNCVWLPGADIDDHGLVSMEMETGVKASLFWTLFGPDAVDQETVEFVGDKGRLILTRQTGSIDLATDHGARTEKIDAAGPDASSSHFGADIQYIRELGEFARGATPVVGYAEGLLAARIVEAVHRSAAARGQLVEMSDIEDLPSGGQHE